MKYKEITGVILAGGENKRYNGSNKTFVSIGNKRIIDHTVDILQEIFCNITIITNKPSEYSEFKNIIKIKDIIERVGPIGGIYTALITATTEMIFVVACDMPYIEQSLAEKVIKISKENNYITTVPFSAQGLEPLFGVYNKKNILQVENAIRNNNFSITELLGKLPVKLIELEKNELNSLLNINSPYQIIQTHYVAQPFRVAYCEGKSSTYTSK